MKLPFALASILAASLPAAANPGTATLTAVSEPGFNVITLTFSPPLLPMGTGMSTLSGTVEVLLEIDPETDQVSELTVTGGSLSGSPVTIAGSNFFGNYNLTSSTLGAEIATPVPPGLVDPATGEFDSSQHTFTVNSGTLDGNIAAFGLNEAISFDFAETPVGGAGSESITGTVTLTPTGSTPTSKSYTAIIIMPVDVQESFEIAGPTGPIVIPITATGSAKFAGPVTIEITPANPYVAWTESNGIPGALFDGDENGDRVPNGLQWALGLDAGQSPYPFLLDPVGEMGATVEFTVTLPPGGSAGELNVLVTDDPEGALFTPLASGAVSAGNPIPAGTSGVVTISLPKETTGFVRLSVDPPGL